MHKLNVAPTVIAVVPAHNEEEQIGACLESLLAQTRRPDRILVVLDNCTDETEDVVRGYPVDLMVTHDNRYKKAGALNQALPGCHGYDYVMVLDADAEAEPHFVERALAVVDRDPRIGAMSCRESMRECRPGSSLKRRIVHACLRYQRHLWDTMRMERPHDVMILIGSGLIVRTKALLGIGGWNTEEATEDTALSVDLRLAGWRTVLGERCFSLSDCPLDFRPLWRQRVRWARGELVFHKRPWAKGSWRGKGASLYQWFLVAWYLILATVDLANLSSFRWWWWLPLVLLYFDRLWRVFRMFPKAHVADVILALPPLEILLFMFWQAPRVVALAQGIRRVPYEWYPT